MFWKRQEQKDSPSLQLDKQVENSYREILLRNLNFSINIRLGLTSLLFGLFLFSSFFNGIGPLKSIPLLSAIALYGIVNLAAKHFLKIKESLIVVLGYLVPSFEIVFACVCLKWLNPFSAPLIVFGSDAVLFCVILIFASLHVTKKQLLYITGFLVIVHGIFQYSILTDEFFVKYSNTDINQIVNKLEILWYSFYYIIIGIALSFKSKEAESLNNDIQRIWIPKIIGGAYQDITRSDSTMDLDHYSIFSITQYPDNYIGADYFRAEKNGDDISLIVGDVVSHGINVAQGALVCLAAFMSEDDKDPGNILKRINRALFPIKQEHGGESLAIAFILKPDGTVIYNGYLDRLSVMRIDHDGVKKIDLECEGVLLGKNTNYVPPINKTFKMHDQDNLVILTDGAANNDDSDDKTSVIITYNSPDVIENYR